MNDALLTRIEQLAAAIQQRHWFLGTAESCTGGLVSSTLTELEGSSNWFSHGVVTYSDAAKQNLLAVPAELIQAHGAVSEPVARAMAKGVLNQGVDVAVSITGIAGPGGGTTEKPVGTVWIGYGSASSVEAERFLFDGTRHQIRQQAVVQAIGLLYKCIKG